MVFGKLSKVNLILDRKCGKEPTFQITVLTTTEKYLKGNIKETGTSWTYFVLNFCQCRMTPVRKSKTLS